MRGYFHKTPAFLKLFYPSCVWNSPSNEKKIYLTFDDGPQPGVTDFVLDQLAYHDAKATFFCLGENAVKYGDFIHRIINDGHKIANHTYSHLNGWRTSTDVYLKDVERCDEALYDLTGKKPNAFRPPYGKMTWGQRRSISTDHRIIIWDYLSGDFDLSLDPGTCLGRLVRHTSPGSIIVFHDNEKSYGTLREILVPYLIYLKDEGFIPEVLSKVN